MKNKVVLFILGLSIVTLLLSGCGDDDITIPVGDNGDSVSVGGDEGSEVKLESEDGESVSVSSSQELPEEFPDEIPFPGEYKIISSVQVNEGDTNGLTVSYLTESMTVDEIMEMYKVFMNDNGYELISEMNMDGINSLSFHNDKLSINSSAVPEDSGIMVNVSASFLK
ncbi:hypothetical protein [Virgibacillus salinus]|uniref:Sporulation and spore germination n=1 Tax=Virgibacillus salinus TaxID=553311 RepID=A0A1H0YR54_9BACI|nr:hypothetical protein [Virgibacillus salinus]SDQ17326.1 hypothetical protein SAMN05216231_0789 [Virgibacillus salinus]